MLSKATHIQLFGLFLPMLLMFTFSCQKSKKVADHQEVAITVKNQMIPTPLSQVTLSGKIGAELERVLEQRILSTFAAEEIIPEATNAFRTKQDDKFLTHGEKRGIWQGEFWGKWMLSAIAAYEYKGDPELKETIRKETLDLIATQREDGYIGTYEHSDLVEGNVWNVWCRKYTLWGLVEAYELLEMPEILEAAQRHMDHLMTEVGPNKVPITRTGNFVGLPSSSILSPLVLLYRITGEQRYLDYAIYIVENWASDPGNPPDIVNQGITGKPVHLWFPDAGKWTKAYEFISCVEGLVDLYQIVGDDRYLQAAENIFRAIRDNERVITGGIGYHDKLVGASAMAEGLNEPCDVVYWERLAARLMMVSGDQQYANEIERLTYNTLLGAFNMTGDWGLRRMGLNEPHLVAPLHCYTHHHQCCVANVPRGLLQLGEVAVMTGAKDSSLFINLFLPGVYNVSLADGQEAELEIETNYPETGTISIRFVQPQPVHATVKIRKPEWSQNAEVLRSGTEATFKEFDYHWELSGRLESNAKISLSFELSPRIIDLPGDDQHKAIMRGPVVLARTSMLEEAGLEKPLDFTEPLILSRVDKQPAHIWMQYQLTQPGDKFIPLIDYSSTGRIYEKPQDPNAIKEMLANRVPATPKVWHQVYSPQ